MVAVCAKSFWMRVAHATVGGVLVFLHRGLRPYPGECDFSLKRDESHLHVRSAPENLVPSSALARPSVLLAL